MQYQLYIDVFFLVNFMMDYLVLLLTGKLLRQKLRYGWICAGAIAGAVLTCVMVALPMPGIARILVSYIFLAGIMLKIALRLKGRKELVKAYLFLYLGTIVLGGVMQLIRPYVRGISLFFALSVAGYYITYGILQLLKKWVAVRQRVCHVWIYEAGKCTEGDALLDTGNCLRDLESGKMVSIADREMAEKIFAELLIDNNDSSDHRDNNETNEHQDSSHQKFRYIPFRTVGMEDGKMAIANCDFMCIEVDQQKRWITHPCIGVSQQKIGTESYQMIINPDILI